MSAPAQPAADAGSTPCRGRSWGVVLLVMELGDPEGTEKEGQALPKRLWSRKNFRVKFTATQSQMGLRAGGCPRCPGARLPRKTALWLPRLGPLNGIKQPQSVGLSFLLQTFKQTNKQTNMEIKLMENKVSKKKTQRGIVIGGMWQGIKYMQMLSVWDGGEKSIHFLCLQKWRKITWKKRHLGWRMGEFGQAKGQGRSTPVRSDSGDNKGQGKIRKQQRKRMVWFKSFQLGDPSSLPGSLCYLCLCAKQFLPWSPDLFPEASWM